MDESNILTVTSLKDPPPGRRRSPAETRSLTDIEPHNSVDADPSEALTSYIAASILQEGYGVQAANHAVPLKVQDAVGRCLQEVSTTVQGEYPHWALPTYHSHKPRLSTTSSDSNRSSDYASWRNRRRISGRVGGHDNDPLLNDQAQGGLQLQGSGHRPLVQEKKAKALDGPQGYPCPFRRRNPVIFNVRDNEQCAKRPFSDIPELKYAMGIRLSSNEFSNH